MLTVYPSFKIPKKIIMAIIHISGERAIFLLFFDHWDTEYEWWETDISVSQQISRGWYQMLYVIRISSLYNIEVKLWKFFIFTEIEPFSFHFVFTKTLDLGKEKWKLAHLGQYQTRNPIKLSMLPEHTYSTIWGKYSIICEKNRGNYSYFWR